MELIVQSAKISAPVIRRPVSAFRVLQVNDTPFVGDQDASLQERICVCQAPLMWAIRQIWTNYQQIDAVVVGPKYSLSDIISIREVTDRKGVPLILHTLRFDWKAKEIALVTGVDGYHTGPLDYSFINRIDLIKRAKSLRITNRWGAAESFDLGGALHGQRNDDGRTFIHSAPGRNKTMMLVYDFLAKNESFGGLFKFPISR